MGYRLKARRRAIRRGMRLIAGLAQYEGCLAYLGSSLLSFCSSLVTTAADPELGAQAIALGRFSFTHWRTEIGALPEEPDASFVAEHVRAYGAAASLGVRSLRIKAWLRRVARAFRATDYFGFDPRVEPPPADIPDTCTCGLWSPRGRRICANSACRAPLVRMTPYRTWCHAFTSAYCGERYGVLLGSRYRDTMRWLPFMRPYRIRARNGEREFYDAAYAITHIVYTMNDFGRYLVSPYWLPWEYEFLRAHLETAMAMNDPDMVGEFMDTLRAFGVGDDDPQVRRGFDFLLDTQNSDGSWADWDAGSLYTGFHATWAAIDGLREFAWTGPGLLFPELLSPLSRWARLRY